MVQYYGEHVTGDGRLDSLPADGRPGHDAEPALHARLPLRRLRAHRRRAAGRRLRAAQAGLRGEPRRLALPGVPRLLRLPLRPRARRRTVAAADWYQKAAAIPGSPAYLPRLAAALARQGRRDGEGDRHVGPGLRWTATSTRARRRWTALDRSSADRRREARMKALAPLSRHHAEGGLRGTPGGGRCFPGRQRCEPGAARAMTALLVVIAAVYGLLIGSFLNAWAWRLAHDESITQGPLALSRSAATRSAPTTTSPSSAGCCCAGAAATAARRSAGAIRSERRSPRRSTSASC